MNTVLFDLNGTLLFDTPKHAAAWDAFARKHCGRSLGPNEYRDCLAGKDNRATLVYLFGHDVTDEQYAAYAREKEATYHALCQADPDFSLAPGVTDFLSALKARNIPYMIVTSAGARNIRFYYERLELSRWFDRETQLIHADGKMPSKPHPAIYLRAMEQLGVKASDCLVFEDLATGIASGVASGAGAVIAVASAMPKERLEALPGVRYSIPDFTVWPRFFEEGLL